MAYGYQFDDLKNGYSISFNTQQNAACGIIEYIFNKTDMNDFKDMFFRYYETIAFKKFCDTPDQDKKDYYEKTVKYKQQEFKISRQEWDGVKFWFFRIFVCCDMEAVKKNIDAISCYEDLERYKNGRFDIKHLKPLAPKKQLQLEVALKNIRDSRNTDSNFSAGEKSENKDSEKQLQIAKLVGEIKNDDEIKKLKDEILDGIRKDWCNKLQFCQPLDFTDKKKMSVKLSRGSIVNSLVEDNAFFPQKIHGILEKRYETMERNCRKNQIQENWDDKENNLNIEDLEKFPDALLGIPQKDYFESDFWVNFFTNYNNIGHDMPVWLYYENITEFPKLEDRPRVMIVSQDPLRNNHDEDKVYLSTPFGFHSLDYLQTKDDETKKSMVRMFVHLYLRQGYIVYLTDVMKLFGCDRTSLQKLNELKEKEPHKTTYDTILKESKRILKKEIEYFKPDFIVSLGGPVAEALTGAWNDKKNDHRNRVVPLLDELCHDRQHAPSVYVRYHTNAHSDDNLHFNDPEYWYVRTK